jgi:hypothetical protein
MSIESEVTGLIARLLFEQDRNKGANFANFFAPDGIYHPVNQEPVCGREAIREYFKKRDVGLTRHIVSNVALLSSTADEAEIASIMTVYVGKGDGPHPAKPAAVLDCKDRLVRLEGKWMFKHREMMIAFRG